MAIHGGERGKKVAIAGEPFVLEHLRNSKAALGFRDKQRAEHANGCGTRAAQREESRERARVGRGMAGEVAPFGLKAAQSSAFHRTLHALISAKSSSCDVSRKGG